MLLNRFNKVKKLLSAAVSLNVMHNDEQIDRTTGVPRQQVNMYTLYSNKVKKC